MIIQIKRHITKEAPTLKFHLDSHGSILQWFDFSFDSLLCLDNNVMRQHLFSIEKGKLELQEIYFHKA